MVGMPPPKKNGESSHWLPDPALVARRSERLWSIPATLAWNGIVVIPLVTGTNKMNRPVFGWIGMMVLGIVTAGCHDQLRGSRRDGAVGFRVA